MLLLSKRMCRTQTKIQESVKFLFELSDFKLNENILEDFVMIIIMIMTTTTTTTTKTTTRFFKVAPESNGNRQSHFYSVENIIYNAAAIKKM